MTRRDSPGQSPREIDVRAWQREIARSVETPWLLQALSARVTELLPHVARCQTQLDTLPRRARRAWQRQLARSAEVATLLSEWSYGRSGRALQRQLARTVAGAALLLALTGVGDAATITVTTNKPAINDGDGKCSLIEAIVNANDGAGTYSDCAAGSGPSNTIVLPKATFTLTTAITDPTYYDAGLPPITTPIIIEGNGAKIVRKATAPPFRLATVTASGDLTLRDVTLSGGNSVFGGAVHSAGALTIENSEISNNDAAYLGGGISIEGGTLTIESSTISGNTVGKGGQLAAGGGIAALAGTVTITNSTISRNQALATYLNAAAGIGNDGATMIIDRSTISANKAGGEASSGGGISNYGDLTITNSTISGNKAVGKYANYGGGIDHLNGMLTIRNSTISKNKAGSVDAAGGGIYTDAPASIENSTISGNKANGKYGSGGGIYNTYTLTIKNATITGNKAGPKFGYGGGIGSEGTLTLERTLISGNKGGIGRELYNYAGTVTADNFNLFGSKGASGTAGFSPAAGSTDIVPSVPTANILKSLADNGGPTKTHALKVGSPAVDAVPNTNPACDGSGTDQRGIARPQPPGGNCDIGAFERE